MCRFVFLHKPPIGTPPPTGRILCRCALCSAVNGSAATHSSAAWPSTSLLPGHPPLSCLDIHLSLSLSLFLSLSFFLSLSLFLSFFLSLSLSFSFSFFLSLSLSLSFQAIHFTPAYQCSPGPHPVIEKDRVEKMEIIRGLLRERSVSLQTR